MPLAQIRAGLPVLSNPGNKKKAVTLTRKQFRYGFGNAIPQAESDDLFDRWAIPGPGRPLFEASAPPTSAGPRRRRSTRRSATADRC